jgi:hypothetical protein
MSKEKIIAYLIIFFMFFLFYIYQNSSKETIISIIFIFIICLFGYVIFNFFKERVCPHCKSLNTSCFSKTKHCLGWKYSTKKGLPDKRVKNNKILNCVVKEFKCKNCNNNFESEKIYEE